MRPAVVLVLAIGSVASVAADASAQRLPFERSLDVSGAPKLDVSTIRGKIDVSVGGAGQVVVSGTVTVRVGLDVPSDALEIARRIANDPPIERDGSTVRLRPPPERNAQRAVTVSYQVRVPQDTEVSTVSDSGATTVRDVGGPVTIRTQSATIGVRNLGGTSTITTGSGAVTCDGVAGPLTVTTSSSAFTGRSLGSSLRVRTTSGAVEAGFAGKGDVDVETGSSAIRVTGVHGALTASTQSGRITLAGTPTGTWSVSTGSSGVELSIAAANFGVEAESGSGSVKVDNATVQGSVSKGRVSGSVGTGGPLVKVTSRSGSIRIVGRL